MKLLPPIAIGLVSLLAGCNANPETSSHEHWTVRSVSPSWTRNVLGYDPEVEGRYIDYQYRNKKSIYKTLKRHILNENPDNPFLKTATDFYEPRAPQSILPRPWEYINFEGMAMGGIILASGGAFIPIPVDSVIGTFSDGGSEEFAEGIHRTITTEKRVASGSYLHEAIGMQVTMSPVD